MALSGTYAFAPNIGSLALNAFSRCGVKRTEVLAQHMQDAYFETNLMQASWVADVYNNSMTDRFAGKFAYSGKTKATKVCGISFEYTSEE